MAFDFLASSHFGSREPTLLHLRLSPDGCLEQALLDGEGCTLHSADVASLLQTAENECAYIGCGLYERLSHIHEPDVGMVITYLERSC